MHIEAGRVCWETRNEVVAHDRAVRHVLPGPSLMFYSICSAIFNLKEHLPDATVE